MPKRHGVPDCLSVVHCATWFRYEHSRFTMPSELIDRWLTCVWLIDRWCRCTTPCLYSSTLTNSPGRIQATAPGTQTVQSKYICRLYAMTSWLKYICTHCFSMTEIRALSSSLASVNCSIVERQWIFFTHLRRVVRLVPVVEQYLGLWRTCMSNWASKRCLSAVGLSVVSDRASGSCTNVLVAMYYMCSGPASTRSILARKARSKDGWLAYYYWNRECLNENLMMVAVTQSCTFLIHFELWLKMWRCSYLLIATIDCEKYGIDCVSHMFHVVCISPLTGGFLGRG